MSRSVVVSYELHPPSDVVPSGLSTSKTHKFPLADGSSIPQYYDALRQSITQAKDTVGEELTTWRDAVGGREADKEPKTLKEDDEEENEEDETSD
ncbi:unnamed protein product [Somion occarium]|uniref:EKC/KEOPS complex subunit GON7 n=1 Tax=Somion occarium TaxID=3059160 RepID=A0ABP1CJG2_9APHY